MAVVAEYKLKHGTALIDDSAYAGKTEEELERVREEARRIAWRIATNAAMREKAGEPVNLGNEVTHDG